MSENMKNNDEKIIALKENEEKNPIKKRELIKTLIIIFLAAMLLLTFFSNTIMNRSLPEITTETTSSGKLTERVRGSGMIMSNQTYEVTIDSVRVIEKINIKSGQKVKKDDVLFTVTVGSSAELREAETALDSMMLQYQTALLSEPVDYSSENQAIKNAREDLNQAIARRDQAYNNQANIEQAQNQYLNDKQELSILTAKQGKLSAAISAIDSDNYSAAPPEYTGNLPVLYGAYADADAEYNTAYGLYSKAVEEGTDEAVVNTAKADADAKMTVRDDAKRAYDDEKIFIRSDLAVQLADLEYQITDISGRITQYESNSQGGGMSYEDCVADVRMKERALEELMIALQKAQKTDNINNQISNLNLEAQKKAIDKQKEKIAELKEKTTATEIKSKYDGVVNAVNVQPDDSTTPGVPLALIDIAEEGYTVEITVDSDKVKKIKTGVKAELVNNFSGKAEAVLQKIKNDTTAGSRSKILEFSVTGDVESGTFVELSIPCGSASYDAIVPKSAVYQDKDGSFVLKVRSKSSPFGNRYYAERVMVEVLASDETSSAVQGGISRGDSLITAASKPVSAGDQVRMKDK